MNPRKLLCSAVDRWLRAPRFTATLHKRVLFDVVEQCCKTAFEPRGKLQWINGYCSQVSCWGLACAIVSGPRRSLLPSTCHKPCRVLPSQRRRHWLLCLFFGCKREVVIFYDKAMCRQLETGGETLLSALSGPRVHVGCNNNSSSNCPKFFGAHHCCWKQSFLVYIFISPFFVLSLSTF